jgi:hypothetical protein
MQVNVEEMKMKYVKIDSCVKSYQWVVVSLSMLLGLTALPATSLAGLGSIEILSSKADQLHGGEIMPPSARPFGFSLSDMAAENAQFVTSQNDPHYLPTTPFQIFYFDPHTYTPSPVQEGTRTGVLITGSNNFTGVPAGTLFYVPIAIADDSPPVLGTFPMSPSEVPSYWFDSAQLGGSDSITVDGQKTSIGATYLVGPITTQPLQDGGGMHIITMGVFLTPFNKGAHTVSITTRFDGAFILQTYGINFIHGEFTFNVTVQ